jgi:RimJ/RimL family protein N-acetyltransferase
VRQTSTVTSPVIRPYEARDRAAVRRVCFVTGYMGEPVAWQWRDAESFADIFSGYYTDREPASALVVEIDGEVSGYLLGCVDTTKVWDVGRVAARHIVRRGIALRPGTAGVVWRTVLDAGRDLRSGRVTREQLEFSDPRWPAHLHIDLLQRARGKGAGRILVTTWLDSLRALGVPGCHLQTMAENTGALAFFEALGFIRHGEPVLTPGLRARDGGRLHVQAMTLDL